MIYEMKPFEIEKVDNTYPVGAELHTAYRKDVPWGLETYNQKCEWHVEDKV